MFDHTPLHGASHVKLKSHVYFAATPEGVLFDAGEQSFLVKGNGHYPLIARLIGLLDEGHALPQVLQRAPEPVAALFRTVLDSLARHGMLVPTDAAQPAPMALAAHRADNELRKVLEDRLPPAAAAPALARWRAAQVVVAGSGQSLASAAQALADCGCGSLRILLEAGPDAAASAEALRAALARGEGAPTVSIAVQAPDPARLNEAGMVLYVSDDGDAAIARSLDGWLRESGTPGAIAGQFSGHACVLPPAVQGDPGVPDLLHWLPPAEPDGASHGPMSMALLGCVAAQCALYHFLRVDHDARRGLVHVVSPELEITTSMLVSANPARRPPAPLAYRSKYQALDDRPLSRFEQFKLALEPWFDPLLGPFSVSGSGQLRQMPLLLYPVRVRSAQPDQPARMAIGWGLELADAGMRGLCEAIELWAAPFAPPGAALAAGPDRAAVQARARALAIVAQPAFCDTHCHAFIALDQWPDPQARLLLRLLDYHAPGVLRVQLLWSPSIHMRNAYACRAWADGQVIGTAAGATAQAAVSDVLGIACRHYQMTPLAPDAWAGRTAVLPPPGSGRPADWQDGLAQAPGPDGDATLIELPAAGLPAGVVCGYVQWGEAA